MINSFHSKCQFLVLLISVGVAVLTLNILDILANTLELFKLKIVSDYILPKSRYSILLIRND